MEKFDAKPKFIPQPTRPDYSARASVRGHAFFA